MDRKEYISLLRSREDIMKMISVAFKEGKTELVKEGIIRLNSLTGHLLKALDKQDIRIKFTEAENHFLTQENYRLTDEVFLNISDSKGAYLEAKKRLDDFYNGL